LLVQDSPLTSFLSPSGEEVVNSKKFPLPNGERVRVRGNWAKTNVTEH